MSSDKLEIGALPTRLGWVVISLNKSLLVEAGRQLALVQGEKIIDINGVRFELRSAEKMSDV